LAQDLARDLEDHRDLAQVQEWDLAQVQEWDLVDKRTLTRAVKPLFFYHRRKSLKTNQSNDIFRINYNNLDLYPHKLGNTFYMESCLKINYKLMRRNNGKSSCDFWI
jgi:hypothetical protein